MYLVRNLLWDVICAFIMGKSRGRRIACAWAENNFVKYFLFNNLRRDENDAQENVRHLLSFESFKTGCDPKTNRMLRSMYDLCERER